MAIYEYETKAGRVRAYYQTQTTNGSQGYFENFMGDQGTLLISESEAAYSGMIYRDVSAPAWDAWIQKGYVSAPKVLGPKPEGAKRSWMCGSRFRRTSTGSPSRSTIRTTSPIWRISSMRFAEPPTLNCPAEVGYETAVTVLKVNEAIEANRRLTFSPEEFSV